MSLILVANPGSASRKYALFDENLSSRGELHIEMVGDRLTATSHRAGESHEVTLDFSELDAVSSHLDQLLKSESLLGESETITKIGLRVVAPSEFFMRDHVMTEEVIENLRALEHLAPLHISATLRELEVLRQTYPDATIVGVSDSAFHHTKPNYAWNYGIDIHDADRLGIKRFGYHGISVAASVQHLWASGKLPPRLIVCHLGSGSSVSAVFHGRSIDTTMGFTPNEGLVMATRSGTISPDAARALQSGLSIDDAGLEHYLNTQGGLLGIGGSNDIRELLVREAHGDHMAHLALTTLIHSIHKAIGSMLVAMNGCDMLVFTGTAGERSAILRKRIVAHLEFLDFILDGTVNEAVTNPEKSTIISQKVKSRPVIVIPTNEAREIAAHVGALTKN